jgi:hypothetical protein
LLAEAALREQLMEEEAKKPKQHRRTMQKLKKLKQILGDTEEQRLAIVADRFIANHKAFIRLVCV